MKAHPAHVLTELKDLILVEIADQSNIMQNGYGIQDFASYREIVGKILALRKVIDFFEEAESNVEKRT